MFVKVRKIGSSKILIIPKSFHIPANTKMKVSRSQRGAIIYTPTTEHKNPFEGNWFNQKIKQGDSSQNIKFSKNEWN